jgi:hypothetical protein
MELNEHKLHGRIYPALLVGQATEYAVPKGRGSIRADNLLDTTPA